MPIIGIRLASLNNSYGGPGNSWSEIPLFITKTQIFSSANEALAIIQYDRQLYRPDLFASLQIDYPQSIRTSGNERQAEYLAGRLGAKLYLRRLECKNLNVQRGSSGKPHWPGSMAGSVSHTHQITVSLVHTAESQYSAVGVNVEELSELIMSDQEAVLLTPEHFTKEQMLHLFFSVKESAFKMLAQLHPCILDFHDLRLSHLDQHHWQLVIDSKQIDCRKEGRFALLGSHIPTVVYI